MKCPGCGYVSFDLLESCKNCGAPMAASAGPSLPEDPPSRRQDPGKPPPEAGGAGRPRSRRQRPGGAVRRRAKSAGEAVARPLEEFLPVDEADLDAALAAGDAAREGGALAGLCVDDDLFLDGDADTTEAPQLVLESAGEEGWPSLPALCDPDGPGPPAQGDGTAWAAGPIIDREEEVPERYWAPEVAGLWRRALALLVDQALLAAVLGLLVLSAWAALRFSGLESDELFAAAALQAALWPFALLATLASLAYFASFHARDGRTPGKALVGIEVRTRGGEVPSLGRVLLRWIAAALGVCCAGLGMLWPVFHPRRCGWADLVSATVVARRRNAGAAAPARR